MNLKTTFRCLFLLSVLLLSRPLRAQNGWDDVRRNDHISARRHFSDVLAKDTANAEALKGLIYLSELEGDNLSYRKYVRSLLHNHWNENLYAIYRNVYSISNEELLKKPGLSLQLRIPAEMYKAYELQGKGRDKEANDLFRQNIGDYEWSVIGPFKNLAGSGYEIPYAVEKSSFYTDSIYADESGMQLKWVQCRHRNPDGSIYFSYYLPDATSGVYYANTFLKALKTQKIQFRVGRSAPMKIWLDDQLIFARDETIAFGYDNEIAELEMPAGTHRLLVKYALDYSNPLLNFNFNYSLQKGGFKKPVTTDIPLFDEVSNSHSTDDPSEAEFEFPTWQDYSFGSQVPVIRITDTSGKLIREIASGFQDKYAPQSYKVSFSGNLLIDYFRKQTEKSPEDLFAWYSLEKAYVVCGLTEQGEETIIKAWRMHRQNVFFKYLAASIYKLNGKKERFYEALGDVNQKQTPIFGLLYEKFLEKDELNDEDDWLSELNRLDSIAPSNYDLIKARVRYYEDKGLKNEKKDYINRISERYPVYKDALKSYIKDNKGDENESSGPLMGLLGKDGSEGYQLDYGRMQRYKRHGRFKKVVASYDNMIRNEPYNVDYRKQKAEYLKDKKKYAMACTELRQALNVNPFSQDIYEALGDVQKEMDAKDSALYFYKKAKYFARNNPYGFTALDSKIEKVQDQKQFKKLFSDRKFEDMLADTGWQSKYANEDAVVLMYTRNMVLDEFNHAQLFQKFMLKVLTDAGVNKWTEYDFSFLGTVNSARIIKANGTEIVPDMQGGYAVFKNLAPGDVIEMEGTYSWQPSSELDNELTLVTFMSFEAPMYYGKFEVAMPKGKYLGHLCHKIADNLKKETRDSLNFYTWEYNDVHKAVREEATLDDYDLIATIMVSTMPDWGKVVKWYQHQTYKKLEGSYEIKEVLDSIISPKMTQDQKVKAIYNYLTKDIKYSFVPFLQSGYTPKRCGLTLSSRIGDCKDVATVMIAMLRQVGIESYYTLVKTNMFDHQRYLPSQYFDHVIAGYITGGKLNFLDMTTDFYPSYVLTEADVNAYALLIRDGENELFQLPKDNLDPEKGEISIKVEADLTADRSVSMKVKAQYPGIAGGSMRENLSRIPSETEQKNFLLDHLGKGVFPNIELEDYKFNNLLLISDTLLSDYHLKANGFADKVGSSLLIFRAPFMEAIRPSQALMSKIRYNRLGLSQIVDVQPSRQTIEIHLPKGYKLLELPQNVSLKSRFGEYSLSFSKTKEGVLVSKYQRFTTDQIAVEDFTAFKEFYFQIMDADASRMAIQKVAGSAM